MTARSYHQLFARGHRSICRLMRSAAVIVAGAAGIVTPSATLADGCAITMSLDASAGLSLSHRSIVLLEGQDPANLQVQTATTESLTAHAGLSPSQRSIVLIEGRNPESFSSIASNC